MRKVFIEIRLENWPFAYSSFPSPVVSVFTCFFEIQHVEITVEKMA